MKINRVAIIGMGALGMMYGTHSIDHGHAISYIMNRARVEKYKDKVFTKNEQPYQMPVCDCEEAEMADLVMVAVKYQALPSAIEDMKRCVGPHTIIMSVMNGIDSEEILSEAFGEEHLIYTVAQGMDAMKEGESLHYTKMGQLFIGARTAAQEANVDAVQAYFEEIKMPYVREKDIMYRLWSKFMLNVGINQCCMVYNTSYHGCLIPGEANRSMIAAMREVVALANAEGIPLRDHEINNYVDILKTLLPEAVPSMQQDALAHRPSEVEMFAGTVVRRAKAKDILVPTNEFLWERVREIEASW